MADLLGGLAGLTIRAPRARMPGLALWGTGQDDDLVISRRNQPAPFSTPLQPAPTITQPQAPPTTELDLLEPLPRLCSWGTACGSLTLSRQCSASTAQGSPLASLRMRMWKPMGPRSPTSSRASHEGSPACGQRWSTLGPGPFRRSSVLGNMFAQSLPFTSQAIGSTSLTRRRTPTTPLGCQRLSSLSATDLVMVGSMAELTATDDDLACSNLFQPHQPQPNNNSHPFTPEHNLPLHAVPTLDLGTGTGCRPSEQHHNCSSVMGDCCPQPTLHPSIHSLPITFPLPSACQPASISPFQAASVQVLRSPPPELDVSSFMDTEPAPSDTVPSTARAPTTTDPHCGLAFLSPIRPVHTPPRHPDRPVSHDILNDAHFHSQPAADEFYLDSAPAFFCNPYNTGLLPAVFANPFLRAVDGDMGSNGSSALCDAEGLDALFPLVPAWMDGIGNADQDLPGLGEALHMSWVDWGALNSDQDSEASSDCSTLDTGTNSMELACQSEYDGLAPVVVPCLVHRSSETIVDL